MEFEEAPDYDGIRNSLLETMPRQSLEKSPDQNDLHSPIPHGGVLREKESEDDDLSLGVATAATTPKQSKKECFISLH